VNETNNLKGVAWDIFTLNWGKAVGIRRLDFIRAADGHLVGPNDIFANDQAAREFVEVMASHGDVECVEAMVIVRQYEEDLCQIK
jgi:hypothetical protein